MDGGGNFRANFGVERNGESLLAGDGSHSKDADLTTGYPEFDHIFLKKLGWWSELTDAEKAAAEGKNWKTDLSGGIQRVVMQEPQLPSLRQRQGAGGGLELPRPDPAAPRGPVLDAPRPRRQVPDPRRQEGVLAPADALQERAGEEQGHRQDLPADHELGASGGIRGRRRGDAFQPLARRAAAGDVHRDQSRLPPTTAASATASWSGSSRPPARRSCVRALVTERVDRGTVWLPFHFSGRWQGVDLLPYYPDGAFPIVRGEAVNTATTYGYDSVTMMQESKTTVCQVERAST